MYTLTQYMEDALQSKKEHESADLAKLDWLLGICGECLELEEAIDRNEPFESVVKEIGDNIWYTAAMLKEYPRERYIDWFFFPNTMNNDWGFSVYIPVPMNNIKSLSLLLCELYKKQLFHKNDLLEEIIDTHRAHWFGICNLCYLYGLDVSDVAQLNALKLQHRHNNGNFKYDSIVEKHNKEKLFTETEEYKEIMGRLKYAYLNRRT